MKINKLATFLSVLVVFGAVFAFSAKNADAYSPIKLTSPNGGQFYTGQTVNITWTGGDATGPVRISLVKVTPFQVYTVITNTAPNTGSYSWTIPANVPDNTYKFYVQSNPGKPGSTWNYGGAITISTSCTQTGTGNAKVSLNTASPKNMIVNPGAKNLTLAKIDLINTGTTDICNLNGLQIGSASDLNNYVSNVRIIDNSNNTQVGQTINSFNFNKTYYWEWSFMSLPIKAGTTKSFSIVADMIPNASAGVFNIGIWGVNYDAPGAATWQNHADGNNITVNCSVNSAPSITLLTPNGGGVYQIGESMNVKWTSCNIPSNNTVWIHLENQNSVWVIEGINLGANDGSETIILPIGTNPDFTAITSGTYKAWISTLEPFAQKFDIIDWSDNIFTIN